jgi:tripartite-type tricarboxylate transporter receptor subunit TctC
LTDVSGGRIDFMFVNMPTAMQFIRGNRVRPIGIASPQRSTLLPDLPTIAEAGLPGYESVLHYGIVAPAGLPRPVVDRLNAALRVALDAPDVQQRLAADGAEVLASTPEAYAADIAAEETKWSEIVRKAGVKAE